MDLSNKTHHQKESHVAEAASELFEESKKMANELYEEGKSQINNVHETVKEYSTEVCHHVHAKPLTSLLMAAGVGFILAALLRK